MDTMDIGPLSYKMGIADIDPLSMSYKDRGTVFYFRTLLLGLGRQYLCLFLVLCALSLVNTQTMR